MSQPALPSPFVYLASQSPRREQLLREWGVQCEKLLPGPDEDAEALEVQQPGDTPMRYVKRVTLLKLDSALRRRIARGLPPAPVLCADTTVALGRQILGKPESAAHAVQLLGLLAGQTHRVLTAVAVGIQVNGAQTGGSAPHTGQWLEVSESWVTFSPLSQDQIQQYVNTGEPMGKAGAYGIQGRAALWVSRIRGSYSGIMGLPAYETANVLRHAGVDLLGSTNSN